MEVKVHLETYPNVAPTVMPPPRVPVALKERLINKLDRLTQKKVIRPIYEPTDWVSNMIATKKPDGNICLCTDPHRLNRALKRSHYPLPVKEEILPELSKAKVFRKVDLREGILQVELDKESSKLIVFRQLGGSIAFPESRLESPQLPKFFR